MKTIKICIILTLLLTQFSQRIQAQTWNPATDPNYNLVWQDTFSTLNTTVWKKANNFDHYGEPQVFLNDNVKVQNGKLKIILKHEPYHADTNMLDKYHCYHQGKYGIDYDYTSGWLESKVGFEIRVNSYVEASIKFPYGKSYWPAFWLFKSDIVPKEADYNEIDIVEIVGWKGKDTITSNMHWASPDDNPMKEIALDDIGIHSNYNETYLTYGVLWRADSIIYYVNHIRSAAYKNKGQMNAQRIVFGFAMNQDTSTGIVLFPKDSLRCPDTMLVDYVRVYDYTLDSTYTTNKQKAPYVINPLKWVYKNNVNAQAQVMWQLNESTYNLSNSYCRIKKIYGNNYVQYAPKIKQITSDHLYSQVIYGTPGTMQKFLVEVIGANGQPLANQPFPDTCSFYFPPAQNSKNAKFYAYGDTRGNSVGGNPPHHNAVCGTILNEIDADPQSQTLLLHVGDWNVRDLEASWDGEYFRASNTNAVKLRSKIAIMGVKGNHERYKDKQENWHQGENFKKYFPFPYRANYRTGNDFSYDFDYGPVHFVMIYVNNTDSNLNAQEIDWLDSSLANTDKKWKIIMFHAPVKTLRAGLAGQTTINVIKQKAKQYGVQAVIMGHEHYYSHWVDNGTHYMILGGGGAFIEGMVLNSLKSSDEVYASTMPHFAKFDVQGDVMMVDIIQGDDGLVYNNQIGRRIEKFSIPISTQITDTLIFDNPADYPIISDIITVKAGGELYVKSSVKMIRDGQMIVEPQGKLVIEDTTAQITSYKRNAEYLFYKDSAANYYNEVQSYWQGIEVQGNSTLAQYPESNQGLLIVRNGATIKNAKTAVRVYTKFNWQGAPDFGYGGGIIKAYDANFINNEVDISMYPYSFLNAYNQKPANQRSYFIRCVFETNNDLLPTTNNIAHITLLGVYGLSFKGNTFINLNNALPMAERGTAIVSSISSFNAVPYCDPQNPNCVREPNKFIDLYQGIRCFEYSGSSNLIFINDNEFTDVYKALFISGTNNAEISLNDIKIPSLAPTQSGEPSPGTPYGIYINGGKGFKVQENTLYRPASNGNATINGARGIIVHKTGAVNNEIYKNTLNNLFLSEQAQCANSGTDLPPWGGANNPGAETGLKFFCNTSQTSSASYDMWMGGMGYCDNIPSSLIGAHRFGIAKFQKQPNPNYPASSSIKFLPAGNQFSESHLSLPTTATVDFDNGQAGWVQYSWEDLKPNARFKPSFISSNTDTTHLSIDTVNIDVCPSRISSAANGIPITAQYSELSVAQLELNASITMLRIWQDGGNANLDQQVETTQPWDIYQEFNSLLAESPYLSDDVLIEVIQNPSFTSLMVKLLMIANPHAVHSDVVMYELENRNPAMPQSYIDEIKSQPETSSQLQVLESNVAADNHLVSMISEDIKRTYRADTSNVWARDSLIAFVSRRPGLYDKYELATIYLSYGLYDEMQNTINYIGSNFEMDDELSNDYTSFVNLMSIAQAMQENNLYMGGLSETQRISLQQILANDRPMISAFALSLLMRDNPNMVFNEAVYDVPQNNTRKPKPFFNTTALEQSSEFKLYPNPAHDYTTLQYNCRYENISLVLSDVQGRVLQTIILESIEDVEYNEALINLSNLSPGTYFTIVKTKNEVLWNKKLIITK